MTLVLTLFLPAAAWLVRLDGWKTQQAMKILKKKKKIIQKKKQKKKKKSKNTAIAIAIDSKGKLWTFTVSKGFARFC